MQMYAKVAAVVAVVAIGAVAVWQLGGPGPGAPTSPPSLSPTIVAPSATPAPTPRTAALFVPPFEYTLPPLPEFDYGAQNATYFEIRVPEWNNAGHPGGLIVQSIEGGRTDPCDQASAATTLEPGPVAVFDYLRSISRVAVTNEAAATVGELPARQATIVATPDAACPELWVWVEETESFISGMALRLVSFEVDGEHLVVTIFGEADNEGWAAMADAIVDELPVPGSLGFAGG